MLPLLALRAPEAPEPGAPPAGAPRARAPRAGRRAPVTAEPVPEATLAAEAMQTLLRDLRLAGATAAQAGAIADEVEAFLLDDAAMAGDALDSLFGAIADFGALRGEPEALSLARRSFARAAAREVAHELAPRLYPEGFDDALWRAQTRVAQDWLPEDPGEKFVNAVKRFLSKGRWPRKRILRKVRRYLFSSSWFRE